MAIMIVYGLSFYQRQADYSFFWMANSQDYVVEDVTLLATTDGYYWLKMARELDKGTLGKGQKEITKGYPDLQMLAIQDTPAESLNDFLVGPNALGTTAGDPAALAKVLVDFAKDNEKLVIKGGVLEGRPLNQDQIKAMASLPAKEVLLAQMLGAMNGVPGGFVRVLAAVPQKLLYALTAIQEQKEQPAG